MNNTNTSSIYKRYGICVRFPPKIHSVGIWNNKDPFTYAIPALEVQMVVIFTLTHLLHYPLKRLGIPKLFSEIMAGLILGPTVPLEFSYYTKKLFPIDTQGIIATLTLFGYLLFMFLIGVKTDLSMIRTTGKKAFAIGVLSLLVPFMVGTTSAQLLIEKFPSQVDGPKESLYFVVGLQSLSPFAVVILLLKDLKILTSELGRLAISSAVSSEIMSLSLTFIMNAFRTYVETQSVEAAFQRLGLTICFLLLVAIVIRPIMLWVIRQTPEGRPVKDSYLYSIILLIFLSGAFTHWIGDLAILGPFMIGFAIPDGPPLGSALADKLDSFVSGLLMPLFMSLIALRANLQAISLSSPFVVSTIKLVIVTFLAKVVACTLPAWICKVPFKDALALALLMSSKGIVQMSFYSFFRDDRLFNEEIFAVLITSTAVMAVLIPVFVKQLYDPSRKYAGYQKRSIMHSKSDGEMRIVMCIHRPDNIPAFVNLLDISCPSREIPIMVYAIHLIELHGRASPIFISHQIQQNAENSYSEDVIFAFSRHERQHPGAICTQAFTAICPRKLMHEDICTLSLDRKAALIITPFHRKWGIDGSIESEDLGLRSLNCKILDMAPCSVGILVDRGCHQRPLSTAQLSTHRVAVIFFGGRDDREAVSYAKHMARNSSITLTVVRFIATNDQGNYDEKEEILDSDELDDLNKIGGGSIVYVENAVKDGAETAFIVRDMVSKFDLILVGRHKKSGLTQTSGLEQWSEFPELGGIGDILATSDLKGRASILVLQQQRQIFR